MNAPALSELGVTEFLTLQRAGYLPRGLVVGTCVFSAGSQYDWTVRTGEITNLSQAMRTDRLRRQLSPVDDSVGVEVGGVAVGVGHVVPVGQEDVGDPAQRLQPPHERGDELRGVDQPVAVGVEDEVAVPAV